MLVARRDPFHPGAHDAAYTQDAAGGGAPRFARTVSMLQVVGSLLAIPVGLASAYSIYRANFSVETTCQALRANIVSMIDKSVDASTRHMLVRHDVERFEQSCGAIDPDATAAFKTLLAGDKPAAPVARHVDAAPKEPVRKAEPHPPAIAKLPVAAPPSVAATATPRDPAVSDAQWVDAVRQALLTHHPERPAAAAAKAPVAPEAIQSQWPGQREAALPPSVPAPATSAPSPVVPPAAAAVAPALPPAASVAAPAVPRVDPEHPVPPAAIPDPEEAAAAKPEPHQSRIGRWIARVPLLGPVWENGQN
jgi:hypothetical protein